VKLALIGAAAVAAAAFASPALAQTITSTGQMSSESDQWCEHRNQPMPKPQKLALHPRV